MIDLKPIGEIFKLKATYREIKEELIPRFNDVIRSWMGEPVPTKFRDPEYVYNSTCLTDPLKTFIKGIVESLTIGQPTGGPLEKSFGFGKTHAMILLWHLFNSDLVLKHTELMNLGLTKELIESTLVLGLDFREEKPLTQLIKELRIYSNPTHPASKLKDPKLVNSISSVLSKYRLETELMSHEVAKLISDIMVNYRESGGEPRLFLLIDELGFGLSLKLKTYCEESAGKREGREELYAEITKFLDFLAHLYGGLESNAIPSLILWAIADQDKKDIESLRDRYSDDELIRRRIDAVLKQLEILAERYKRGTGGVSIAAFSYSAKHAIEIAKFRVLKPIEGLNVYSMINEFLRSLKALADQINITSEFEMRKNLLESYYPFSPSLISLITKLMKAEDIPGTEYVRTVISTVAKAAERALTTDPTNCFTISVKHLELSEIALVELLKELSPTWLSFLTDIEHAIEKVPEEEMRDIVAHISKLLAAKGITAILPALLETRDKTVITKYGVSLNELQLDILTSYQTSKALEMIDRLTNSLNYLKAESGRVNECEIDGEKYYLPTIVKTPIAKLASFIVDERSKVGNLEEAPLYIGQSMIPSLFRQLKVAIKGYPISVLMKNINSVLNDLSIDRDFSEAQRDGQLAVIIIPPWDLRLFEKVYREHITYDSLIASVKNKLNSLVKANKLQRPLHVVILLPEVSQAKIKPFLEEELAVYQATKRFIEYLSAQERVVEETVNKLVEVIEGVSKRLATTLPDYAKPGKMQREIREMVARQILDARNIAQKNIVTLSRKLVADTVGLYEKAIYFSVDQGSFDAVSLTSMHRRTLEKINDLEYPELDKYAPIMNKFIEDLVRTIGFSADPPSVANRIKESYKEEFKKGVSRTSDRIEDVAENAMVGGYGIRPLNKGVVYDAIKLLEGTTIDLEDKIIRITLNEQQGLIEFRAEIKKRIEEEVKSKLPEIEILPTIPGKPTVRELQLELPIDLNVQDLTSKIAEVITSLRGGIAEVVVQIKEVKGARISAIAKVKDASSDEDRKAIGSLINLFDILADKYGARLAIVLRFKQEVEIDKLKAILGHYVPKRITTFSDWLP